jgi:leucyl-tRNA synthetase
MKYFYSNMQKFSRRDHLRKIELELQKEWKNNNIFEAKADIDWSSKYNFEEKNKKKFLVTFPYPYMNGRLHLGHAFSMSKCEFMSRYQRLNGKNSLFPFSFHCTGMPIAAAANKVKRELDQYSNNVDEAIKDTKTQLSILVKMGIEKDILTKFADPVFWLEYFPPIGKEDLESLGVGCDFSRSFITTQRNAYYDKFISWQFNKLREAGVIKFGKRYTIFSKSDNQPCADHDRSEGEGVGVQEYTAIKLKVIGGRIPEKLKELTTKSNVFLVACTLRPETMYGQTNAFVLPNGEYGVYENKSGDYIVCSHHSAESMAYQESLKAEKKPVPVMTIKGSDIIGVKVRAPLSFYEEVYVIPLLTISMTKGTGVVTSVPSDAPDDYIALRDFKTDEELRKKYGVLPEYVDKYDPVKIINIPEISDLSAVDLCEKEGVKNQQDKEKLNAIKDLVYLKGFNSGKMLVGKYCGESVELAKKKVKADLIETGDAFIYCEPESLVLTRTGDVAIVALVDQWMISYGEESWMHLLEDHLKSPLFKSYNKNTLKEMINKVGWLKEWGCSRTFGLGSKVPWDQQFLIESLSDSTIYMAFYTISKYFSKDMYGDQPNLFTPDQVDDAMFDYIFLGIENEDLFKRLDRKILDNMRSEFTFWYPMDLRCSGKDLIPNHLTMCLYNHAFIWKKQEMLPRSIFTNGYILFNGEKMSKNKGTFRTVDDIIKDYGADASRLALADCGDGNDDANFLAELANSNINRLYSFENFLKALIKETNWESLKFENIDELKLEKKFDIIFDNNINLLVEETKNAYEGMKYKEVLKYGFYEMINIKDQYILYNEEDYNRLNPSLMLKFFSIFLRIMNPIMPHWTEYIYRTYINGFIKNTNENHVVKYLAFSNFPEVSKNIDKKMYAYNKYLKNVVSSIHELVNSKQGGEKKKGENKKETKEETEEPKKTTQVFSKTSKLVFFIII